MRFGPTLVCLDIQRVFLRDGPLRAPNAADALIHCRRLLNAARENSWEFAHCYVRCARGPFRVVGNDARPVEGFEPFAREMVFERSSLSAYGDGAFRSLMDRASGAVVVAGLSASMTFVATTFDAFDSGHQFLLASDALAGQDGLEASASLHEAVARDIASHLGFAAGAMREANPTALLIGD